MSKLWLFTNAQADYEQATGYETSDFIATSAGGADAGKPIKLDGDGNIDASMINDADVSHSNLTGTHNLTTDIDHDTVTNNHNLTTDIDHDNLTNTHNLTTDIDHDQTTNFAAGEHFTMLDEDNLGSDSNTQAATQQSLKAYIDSEIAGVTGGSGKWKEVLLHSSQLLDGSTSADGIRQAGCIYFTSQPIVTDTVKVTVDGDSSQRTYIFVANQGAESAPTDVSIETDAATAMLRLAVRIQADGSRITDAQYETVGAGSKLAAINSGNDVVVLFLKDGTAIPVANKCGVYGTWGTQASVQVVDFADLNYESSTGATLPVAYDNNFGLGRIQSSLVANEVHMTRENDEMNVWNDDDDEWAHFASPGAYTASLGVEIVSGDIRADLLASGGLKLTGNELGVEPNDFAGEGLADDGSDNLKIDWSTAFTDAKAVKADDLNSATNGEGASIIGIEDAGGYTSQTDVEAALQELYEKVEEQGLTYTAGTNLTKGDLVYISANNTVSKLDMTSSEAGIGLAADTVTATNPVKVLTGGVLTSVVVSATAGTKYFWNYDGATGGWQTTLPAESGDYVWLGGVAKNATDVAIFVEFIMKVA